MSEERGVQMKGLSISEKHLQFVICGVEGAGKKSFISYFFPTDKVQVFNGRIRTNTKKLLFVFILDGIHLQNLAEESIFTDIAEMVKKRRKEIDFSCLLILNKTDLIYSKRHAPGLLASICKEYEAKISALGFMHTYVVAFSYVATKILSRLSQNIIDQDDCDDAIYFLNKIGRRLSEGITPVQMRTYLLQHKRALCLFSGEGPVEKTLTHWRKDC